MKLLFCVALACLGLTTLAQNKSVATATIEGSYQGKNIFIKNTYGPGGVGYCINSVKVNGHITTDKINSDIFQVDLSACKLKAGEKVKVELVYYEGCTPGSPMVLTPGALINNAGEKGTTIVIEGTYKWQNLFVSCALMPNGKGNGVKEVFVNGKKIMGDIHSEIFEVDLVDIGLKGEEVKLKDGDKVKIEFKCEKGYDPLLINPEAIH